MGKKLPETVLSWLSTMISFRLSGMTWTGRICLAVLVYQSAAYQLTLDRQMGQLFMMGFSGTTVDPQVKSLIEDYHVGSILITAKNLKCSFFCITCPDVT